MRGKLIVLILICALAAATMWGLAALYGYIETLLPPPREREREVSAERPEQITPSAEVIPLESSPSSSTNTPPLPEEEGEIGVPEATNGAGAATGHVVPLPVGRAGALSDRSTRLRSANRLRKVAREQRRAVEDIMVRAGEPIRREFEHQAMEWIGVVDGRLVAYHTENREAAISIAADKVRQTFPFEVDGRWTDTAVWDAGSALDSHQEFGGRVVNHDNYPSHVHSTHVAGTMAAAGIVTQAKGMAPASTLHSFNWISDVAEMALWAMATADEPDTVQISNHSYGSVVGWHWTGSGWEWYGKWGNMEAEGFGLYSSMARTWDEICWEAPYYLPVKSAGNDRGDGTPSVGNLFHYYDGTNWVVAIYDPSLHPLADNAKGGYDTIPDVGSAKNCLTVGSVGDAVGGGVRDLSGATISSFSSWGPTDDGRVKPDVVANGSALYSTFNSSDRAYGTLSGTSMAAPSASGGAALVADLYYELFDGARLWASSLKGLLIHCADDLGAPGPDFAHGWGLVNVERAAEFIRDQTRFSGAEWMLEEVLETNDTVRTHEFLWDGANSMRFTLCWTDPPGISRTALDDPTPVLVHDLDLVVISPDGSTNFPWRLDASQPSQFATTGDNDVDNVEQVVLQGAPTAGVYRAVISVDGALVEGAQPYSLLVSGAGVGPFIEHEPLGNQTATSGAYEVDVYVESTAALHTNQLYVHWSTDGASGPFTAGPLAAVSNGWFRGEIPAQPRFTRIYYYLEAADSSGLVSLDPPSAPGEVHDFLVSPPVNLAVYGSPEAIAQVQPDYGISVLPSGLTVRAWAEAATPDVDGHRHRCAGWLGSGDVPASGATNAFTFDIHRGSALMWAWEEQYRLDQTASPAGVISKSTWHRIGSMAGTVSAAPILEEGNGYRFAEWQVDGLRQPDATSVAQNPLTNVLMDQARTAEAIYLPVAEDIDEDGIQDWWERFYFGNLLASWYGDADGDGYLNLEEFQDLTNPRDPSSFPVGPVLVHTPLASSQTSPAPWRVSARVYDTSEDVTATLHWRRNGLNWRQQEMMLTGTPNEYVADIPLPCLPGDLFEYRIEAADSSGYTAEDGPHIFEVVYPALSVTPAASSLVLPLGDTTNLVLHLVNSGNASSSWRSAVGLVGESDDVEHGEQGFVHGGTNDMWHISTRRAYSGSQSWYCGNETSGIYGNSMDASLMTEPIPVGLGTKLTFYHWMRSELDEGDYTWDGGVVEITEDSGQSWQQLYPESGYPYRIVPNPASPFEPNTPCYGGVGGWQHATFDLAEFEGKDVRLRFRFGSDEFVIEEGWYIDDIRITPLDISPSWVDLAPTSGVVLADSTQLVGVVVDSSDAPAGLDETAVLAFGSRDPINPTAVSLVRLNVRTIPEIIWLQARQSSTNGEGFVTIEQDVVDLDGDTCALEVATSLDDGLTWSSPTIIAAGATTGSVVVSGLPSPQISNVVTRSQSLMPLTNRVSATWDTRQDGLYAVHAGVMARSRAWDGRCWGNMVTGTPFMVDNEAPSAPSWISSTTHTAYVWASNLQVGASWSTTADGAGIGVYGYELGAAMATNEPVGSKVVTALSGFLEVPSDGSNWWVAVRGVDVFGNRSDWAAAGPFFLDSTAPSSSSAGVVFVPDVPYAYGNVVTGSWGGFADHLSGVQGYYVSWQDGGGTTNGGWTTAAPFVLSSGLPDATNYFHVWAQDAAGNIGFARSRAIALLSAAGDLDGDGLRNRDEETAGTDPTDSSSVLRFIQVGGAYPEVVLWWSARSGRVYSVESATNLMGGDDWWPLPGHTNLPGLDGTMSRTSTVGAVGGDAGYYRLRVEKTAP